MTHTTQLLRNIAKLPLRKWYPVQPPKFAPEMDMLQTLKELIDCGEHIELDTNYLHFRRIEEV